MEKNEILKQLVSFVENAGICEKYLTQSKSDFINFWFGPSTFTGDIKSSATYLYVYEEPLKGVADAVINAENCKVYLYEIE